MDAAINLTEMENEGNIVGIAAVLNYFGLRIMFYYSTIDDIKPYLLAVDPKTNTSLSFWYDAPTEQVRRAIIESRKAFGVII